MARKKNATHAVRSARADWELANRFSKLEALAMAWVDDGEYAAFEDALDELSNSDREFVDYPKIPSDSPREEQILVLTERYVLASHIMRRVKSITQDYTDYIRDQLIAAVARPSPVPEYMQKLMTRMVAEGLTQPDVHPSSRALARHLVEAVHEFNAGRRTVMADDDHYPELPVSSWQALPRSFGGFTFVDIPEGQEKDWAPCPLPPSTDIADFTVDRTRPEYPVIRASAYEDWQRIIVAWCSKTRRNLPTSDQYVWAFLLTHMLPRGRLDKKSADFYRGRELQSPWDAKRFVRIEVADDDDVPY